MLARGGSTRPIPDPADIIPDGLKADVACDIRLIWRTLRDGSRCEDETFWRRIDKR
jgi:hypothetical protein